jgi:dimethylglycine dehydrogenase
MTEHVRALVIGGGVMGCSVLYHLAANGWKDVMLCEKAELTSGSTWHAAGQMGLALSSRLAMWTVKYSIDLYQRLEAETGQSVGWHEPGSLRMAYDDDEIDWLKVHTGIGRQFDVAMEIVGPDQIANIHPFYNLDGVKAALRTVKDGHADPSGVTQAMAQAARKLGARIDRRNRVTGVTRNGDAWIVHTEKGDISAEHVVIAAGTYANQVGRWFGLTVPSCALLHTYLITDTVPEFEARDTEIPVVRDHYYNGYIRQERDFGLIGVYEDANAETIWTGGCPWEAENELFEPDYDRTGDLIGRAFERMPVLADLGIKRVVRGAITHTPDGAMLIGPAPSYNNVWMACGASIGIAWGGGAGKCLADQMVHGETAVSIRSMDPRRYGDWADDTYVIEKTTEEFHRRHETPLPGRQLPACRPARPTPLYDRLAARGAVMGEVHGLERARWFRNDNGVTDDSYGWRRQPWETNVAAEHRAVRQRAGVIDLTAFSQYQITGRDAAAFLDRMSANRPPARIGGIALAHLLSEKGNFETEMTIARLGETRFFLGSSIAAELRDRDWLAAHIQPDEDVTITNLTNDWGMLALSGPAAREILSQGTNAELTNAAFPWLSAREITAWGVPCVALRVSFTGELGWELYCPQDLLGQLYDGMSAAGAAHGLSDIGGLAFNTLRIEKAYKGTSELTPEVGIFEAGVERFFKPGNREFLGRAATLERQGKPGWRIVYMAIDADDADVTGGEAILANGRCVGMATSGGYGHSVGQSLAFGYVKDAPDAPDSEYKLLILGETRSARVLDGPAYDPQSLRPRM